MIFIYTLLSGGLHVSEITLCILSHTPKFILSKELAISRLDGSKSMIKSMILV